MLLLLLLLLSMMMEMTTIELMMMDWMKVMMMEMIVMKGKMDQCAVFFTLTLLQIPINSEVTLTVLGEEACICPALDVQYNCINTNNYEFLGVQGSLVTVGELFNNFGYGFAFRRSVDPKALKYTTFNQVMLEEKDGV